LIERNGDLIASSVDKRPYKLVNQKAQRLTAEESADAVIRDTSKYLKSKFDGLGSISNNVSLQTIIQGETHYLHVSPWKDWQGLDWLIVIATPERDFLGAFQANTHQTIFLCLVALIVATMIGLWTSRWILVPILGLRDASNALSHDRDDVVAPESNITELNFVSQSFNDMAQRLRSLLEQLKSDNQNLGVQVEEKNQALTEALKLVRYKRDNSAQKQRQVQAYLTILSRQITQPVNLMQDELGNAKENLQAMLDELSNYREQIKQFPPELRQELSSADLDLLIADLQKRVFLIEQGHLHIDDLSQKLNQYIQQIQHIEKS
jgi:methyl-accepting chemotaxis protein